MLRTARAAALALVLIASAAIAADPGIWKIAPPPPASWQRDRLTDLTARRAAIRNGVGEKGVLILHAAEPRNYAGDVDWPYRQENNFYYLTGLAQEGPTLVLLPGAAISEILFLPPSNPAQETWNGHFLTPAEARGISGIANIQDARNLNAFLTAILPNITPALEKPPATTHPPARGTPPPAEPLAPEFLNQFHPVADPQIYLLTGTAAEFSREIAFASRLSALAPPIAVKDADLLFATARRIKSPRELDLLQHAVAITAEAFQRVFAVAAPGMPEYEIQAQFEFTFRRRNAHWGYPCIVAGGVNATTLHYESNRDTVRPGELLLLDDGAEFDGYSADVTRTLPVSGKFSKEQAEIYRTVWEAQQAAIRKVRPGHRINAGDDSVIGAANQVLRRGLFQLGLITDASSDQQLRIWFTHGISHGIGLNVHDDLLRGELQPGMAVTVEPGIYIRPDALDQLPKTAENEKFIAAVRPAFEKYKGIGVRIEDDVVVTEGEPKILSSAIPSRLEDVEAAIALARRAVQSNPLP